MSANGRRPLVGGNWKMHMLRGEAQEYCNHFVDSLGDETAEIALFPSPTLLPTVTDALAGSPVICGGQDIHPREKGAHTGDVSGPQLVDAGCTWVLCGHSERRQDHGESDELVGEKADAAELYAQPDIDGFLVGGASLDPESFLAIIRCCG